MTSEELPVSRRQFREQRARKRGRRAGWILIAVGIPMIVVGGIFLFETGPTGEPVDVRGTTVIRTSTTREATTTTAPDTTTDTAPDTAPDTTSVVPPTSTVTGGPSPTAP